MWLSNYFPFSIPMLKAVLLSFVLLFNFPINFPFFFFFLPMIVESVGIFLFYDLQLQFISNRQCDLPRFLHMDLLAFCNIAVRRGKPLRSFTGENTFMHRGADRRKPESSHKLFLQNDPMPHSTTQGMNSLL